MKKTIMALVLLVIGALLVGGSVGNATPVQRRVFNVADFGATPNTQADSGPAIRKAIAAAIASGQPADVVLRDGTYRVGSITVGTWWGKEAVVVYGAKDLVLRGSGKTVLMVTDPLSAGVVLRNCEKVEAQRFTIDYDPVPQVISKIVAIDPDHNFVEVQQLHGDPDLMTFADPRIQDPSLHILATTYEIRKDGSPMWGYEPVGLMVAGPMGPDHWKLAVPPHPFNIRRDAISIAGLRVGDLLNSKTYACAGAAFSMIANKSSLARDITLHASPGLAFFPHLNDSVSLIGCVIEIKPGSHRVLSTDEDGIHARGNRRIVIENCSIAGTGDDAINLHSEAIVPTQRLSDAAFVLATGTYSVRTGDILELLSPTTGPIIGKYKVKSVDNTFKDGAHVDFTEALPDLKIGSDFFGNLNEANNDFIVRNNTINTHDGRDLLIQASRGLVEHNVFNNQRAILKPPIVSTSPGFNDAMRRLGSASLYMCISAHDAPLTQGVTIRDNRFNGCEFPSPPIWITDNSRPGGGLYSDITIEGNTFTNSNTSVIVARSVTNLVIKNNRVVGKGATMESPPKLAAFDLHGCINPLVLGNTIDSIQYTKEVSN